MFDLEHCSEYHPCWVQLTPFQLRRMVLLIPMLRPKLLLGLNTLVLQEVDPKTNLTPLHKFSWMFQLFGRLHPKKLKLRPVQRVQRGSQRGLRKQRLNHPLRLLRLRNMVAALPKRINHPPILWNRRNSGGNNLIQTGHLDLNLNRIWLQNWLRWGYHQKTKHSVFVLFSLFGINWRYMEIPIANNSALWGARQTRRCRRRWPLFVYKLTLPIVVLQGILLPPLLPKLQLQALVWRLVGRVLLLTQGHLHLHRLHHGVLLQQTPSLPHKLKGRSCKGFAGFARKNLQADAQYRKTSIRDGLRGVSWREKQW